MLMTLVASADSAMALRRSRFWPSVLSVMFMPMKYTARFGHFLADHAPDFTLGLASAAATWPGGTAEASVLPFWNSSHMVCVSGMIGRWMLLSLIHI